MARATHRKNGRSSFVVVLVLLIVVAAGGVAFFLLRNDTASNAQEHTAGTPTIAVPSSVAAATINFHLKQVTPTTIGTPASKADESSQKAANDVTDSLAQFYEQAFLTKDNWDQADYSAAWASVVEESRAAAQHDENLLTLGKDAPNTYSSVAFDNGDVSVQVLLDDNAQPKSAIASVHFNAEAKQKDGGTTAVRSVGRYFLRPEGGRWMIYGYQIRRKDKQQ
ncbi:MAG: hypothetical protein ACJ758_06140 [Actinomycetota bacterium]